MSQGSYCAGTLRKMAVATQRATATLALLVFVAAAQPAAAQTLDDTPNIQLETLQWHNNAIGVVISPVTHRFTGGDKILRRSTNTALDMGLYYTRDLPVRVLGGSHLSVHVEARVTERFGDVPTLNASQLYAGISRLSETFMEFPVILRLNRRVRMDKVALNVYGGGGYSFMRLRNRNWTLIGVDYTPAMHQELAAGMFWTRAFVVDGGVVMTTRAKGDVLLGFRLSFEDSHFLLDDEVSTTYDYLAYGFYAGYGVRF